MINYSCFGSWRKIFVNYLLQGLLYKLLLAVLRHFGGTCTLALEKAIRLNKSYHQIIIFFPTFPTHFLSLILTIDSQISFFYPLFNITLRFKPGPFMIFIWSWFSQNFITFNFQICLCFFYFFLRWLLYSLYVFKFIFT